LDRHEIGSLASCTTVNLTALQGYAGTRGLPHVLFDVVAAVKRLKAGLAYVNGGIS
jgi:hypothetical protein